MQIGGEVGRRGEVGKGGQPGGDRVGGALSHMFLVQWAV